MAIRLAVKLLAALLLLPLACPAAPRPHPIAFAKHHKLLILTSAMYLAADFADTEETIQAQRRCPTCVETSDLYGPHPSPARLWGESAAFDAGYIWLNWFGTKDTGLTGTKDFTPAEREAHPTLYKLVWLEKPTTLVLMGFATYGHARAAYHNAQIPVTRR